MRTLTETSPKTAHRGYNVYPRGTSWEREVYYHCTALLKSLVRYSCLYPLRDIACSFDSISLLPIVRVEVTHALALPAHLATYRFYR